MNINKPLLLIDASYFVFYRFYAVYSWWSRQEENKGKSGKDAMEDLVFREKYNKMFRSVFKNLTKLYEAPIENVIFVKDCPREEIWRNVHYDSYKSTREDSRVSFDRNVFAESYKNIIPSLNCGFLSVDSMEADDIIAIIVKEVIHQKPDADITIITNDNDYVQLCHLSDTINIMNLQGKCLKDRIEVDDPKRYILFKTILGDKSDNIPSIMKSVGVKTAIKLANNEDELSKFFKKYPDAKDQYEKNNILMNFDCIPDTLVAKVKDLLILESKI